MSPMNFDSLWRMLVLVLCALPSQEARCENDYATQRQRMIDDIAAVARAAGAESGKPTISSGVIAAMAKVPRHDFVPADQERFAYDNRPLPIGYGQTISQPYIVALMTDLMRVEPSHTVLEIGTGSGYQA